MDSTTRTASLEQAVAGRDLSRHECQFLISEVNRLRRANEALDLLVAEKDRTLREKENDFICVVMEFDDLNDELTKTQQDLELAKIQLAGRESSVV